MPVGDPQARARRRGPAAVTPFQDAVAGLIGNVSADVLESIADGIAATESKEAISDDLGTEAEGVARAPQACRSEDARQDRGRRPAARRPPAPPSTTTAPAATSTATASTSSPPTSGV